METLSDTLRSIPPTVLFLAGLVSALAWGLVRLSDMLQGAL